MMRRVRTSMRLPLSRLEAAESRDDSRSKATPHPGGVNRARLIKTP